MFAIIFSVVFVQGPLDTDRTGIDQVSVNFDTV